LTIALIAWRHRAPLIVALGTFVLQALTTVFGEPFTYSSAVAVGVAFYTVGAMPNRRRAYVGLALGIAVGLTAVQDRTLTEYLGIVVPVYVAPWILGALVLRGRTLREVEDRSRSATEVAVTAERARLAREIHDVVSHNIGMIVVQAAAADVLLDEHPERTRQALQDIEGGARQALLELRQMLSLLRPDGAAETTAASLSPSSRLDGLTDLLSRVRAAGVPVSLRVVGESRPVDPAVDLAAYRVIQEGLTNVMKHAGPCSAEVTVDYGEDLEVRVADTGRGVVTEERAGFGLAGLAERVRELGGSFTSNNLAPHGFAVTARLPLSAPVTASA
jgi:signal transduction histidine kinase